MSKHSSRGKKWEAVRKAVLIRDGYLCAYCQREANTVDHIVPKSQGGTDDEWNLISACHQCNSTRQDRAIVRLAWYSPHWFT